MRNRHGFSFMELMVTVVAVSAIAAFAIPNFSKGLDKTNEKVLTSNLETLHASLLMYFGKNGSFPFAGTTVSDLGTLTEELGITLAGSNDLTFSYTGGATGDTYNLSVYKGSVALEVDNRGEVCSHDPRTNLPSCYEYPDYTDPPA